MLFDGFQMPAYNLLIKMLAKMPKISIISINYNNADGLYKTIQSVVQQTYKNLEYIIIDGGSVDESKRVIESAEHIDYWVSESDSGIYNAMNKGIGAATGEYLLFLNSGDTLINDHVLAEAVEMGLTHDLVSANLLVLKDPVPLKWIPEDELSFKTFLSSTIPHPSTFIKGTLFKTVGLYNEEFSIISDWEFFLLATCKYNCSYKHIDLFLTAFSDGGISSEPQNYAKIDQEREQVLNRHFSFFIKDYKENELLMREIKKIGYFIKMRRFVKQLFNPNKKEPIFTIR